MGGGWKRVVEVIVWLIIIIEAGCEGCLEEERSALLQLQHFFNSPLWVDDFSADCSLWERVECSNTTGRVIGLYLDYTRNTWESTEKWYLNASLFTPFQQLQSLSLWDNNIAGFVENEALSGLSKLQILALSYNYFNNSILSSLDSLSSLRELYLEGNNLRGSIDVKGQERLSGFNNLEVFNLGNNSFNNNILSSLSGLSSLRELYLSGNSLKGTVDIKEWNSLINLELLDMSGNEIDKIVVPKGLRKLKSLDLSGNNLNRSSISLIGLSSLRKLDLSAIGLKGSFEVQELDSLSNLEVLYMGYNEIDDLVVPKDYKGLRKLRSLTLWSVKIRDAKKLLQSPGSFPSLNTLDLSYNNFTEPESIFQGLCQLVHLQELYIGSCNLTGYLPWCLANMTSLRVLDVSYNQLIGNISTSPLIHLTSIEELLLSHNQFQISISLEPFFNFSKLKRFEGRSNELYAETESNSLVPKFQLNTIGLSGYGNNGTFPKFLYYQHELQQVYLSRVNLIGEFPYWLLENNTELDTIILQNNSLSGSLHMPNHPHQQLHDLDVSNNNFQGNIPIDIGAYLPSLQVLNFSKNAFNGIIPSSFGDMEFLESLDLSNNQLTGDIPEHLAMGCLSLYVLVLSNNNLQGHIFSKKNNLKNLVRLQLDDNHFIGEIPKSLSNCSRLGGLYLSNNNISGKIPTWLGNLSFLEDIIIPNNHLEGPIPTEFCQLHFLQHLDLSGNNISGSLTSCFGLSSIQQIHLSKNMLQGPLEDGTLYNSSSLVTLDLSYNRLNGKIPTWIERLNQLRYLVLANNNLEGEVPNQLCQLKQLRLIDLSHNNLSGHIPPCLDNTTLHEGYYDVSAPTFSPPLGPLIYNGNSMGKEETIAFTTKERSYPYKGKPLNNMYGIDLSCNKLTGEIPLQISELTKIHTLNLSHNNLTGFIPARFSNLKQIESLDLSYNLLNGRIPPQLIELNALAVFRVAYNNLSGKIPDRIAQFSTFEKDSYEGNPFLCGLPLPKSCNENGLSPTITPEASTGNEEDDSLIDMDSFHITFTVSYVIVILGIIGVLWVNPYWRHRWFYLVEMWIASCYYFVVDNFIHIRFYC